MGRGHEFGIIFLIGGEIVVKFDRNARDTSRTTLLTTTSTAGALETSIYIYIYRIVIKRISCLSI